MSLQADIGTTVPVLSGLEEISHLVEAEAEPLRCVEWALWQMLAESDSFVACGEATPQSRIQSPQPQAPAVVGATVAIVPLP